MIDTTELRLGNLVKWVRQSESLEDEIVVVYNINVSSIRACTDIEELPEVHIYDEWIKPITLTEDWVEKLGLIKKNTTDDLPDAFKMPDVDEDGSIWYNWVDGAFNLEVQSSGEIWFEVYSHYIHVKYVHQLQNVYYSLTGIHLTLKKTTK